MRFIRGDSLKEAIDRFHADEALRKTIPAAGRWNCAELLRRFTDVCNAIDYAHSRGVLHRDLKPGNIIVGKHGETLVVDWGLAKADGTDRPGDRSGERTLVPSSASGSAETLPGTALGTPAYMSPEQAEGDLEHLGPRSDVYSLGATLYCLLTGQPPFEGRHRRGAPGGAAGRVPAAPAARCDDRPGAGGGVPEGDGTQARGPLRYAQGAGRGRRAMDGRRAGLGLARAFVSSGDAVGSTTPHGGDGGCWRPCWWRWRGPGRSWRCRREPTAN